MNVTGFVAFTAGLLSFFSPCVVPLLPAYLSYVMGIKKRNFMGVLAFIIGFSLIFILMGASAGILGKFIIHNRVLYRKISGIIIIVFGLFMMGIFNLNFLQKERKFFEYDNPNKGLIGSFLLGISFSAGWTPCVGPILSSILIYAASEKTITLGVLLLFFYSLGLAIPFIISAFIVRYLVINLKAINTVMPYIRIVGGIIMIIFGILTYMNMVERISSLFL